MRDSFDAILTDPPYYISGSDWYKPDGYKLTRDFGEDDLELPIDLIIRWIDELVTVDASVLFWCSDRQVGSWVKNLSYCFDRVVVGGWLKNNPAPNVRKVQWTQATELWVWGARGNYTFNWLGQTAMLNFQRAPLVSGKEKTNHPNQKPEFICERHIRILTNEGDRVLDPFAGSGTYGAMCKKLGRKCISIERDFERAKVAKQRIEATSVQLELPMVNKESPWKRQGKLELEV